MRSAADPQWIGAAMITVKFVKPYSHYGAGERADFQADIADRLITRGIAVSTAAPAAERDRSAPATPAERKNRPRSE
jgi:hypothetical protein